MSAWSKTSQGLSRSVDLDCDGGQTVHLLGAEDGDPLAAAGAGQAELRERVLVDEAVGERVVEQHRSCRR